MPKPIALPSRSYLVSRFSYDAATGELIRKERPQSDFQHQWQCATWNSRWAGKVAGSPSTGALAVNIDRTFYLAHRIIWKIVHDWEPPEIDQIDGDRMNNRVINLRPANRVINMQNTALRSDNKSGSHGVHWDKSRNKWLASITVGGKARQIGRFASFDDALAARLSAQRVAGFHENHGRRAIGDTG